MKDLSFAHIPHFQHRHFLEANHDFRLHHPALFLKSLAADMGVEAAAPAVAMQYQAGHRHSLDLEKCWVHLLTSQQTKLHRALTPSLGPRRKAMPKHMFINEEFRSSGDQGMCSSCMSQHIACQHHAPSCLAVVTYSSMKQQQQHLRNLDGSKTMGSCT